MVTHPIGGPNDAAVGHEDRKGEHSKTLSVVGRKVGEVKILLSVLVLPLPDQEDVRLQGELGAGLEEALHRLELLEVVTHELERSVVSSTDQ